jgi:light-regulated signal transduction histidine kinase (bacteriophytochrome)/CheY-like chemotaxis protein
MSTNEPSPEFGEVDLTNCDREPIHASGHVQSFGCLLAVSPDWMIVRASLNVSTHLGQDAERIIGAQLDTVLSPATIHAIRSRLQLLNGPNAVERLFDQQLTDGAGKRFDIALHLTERVFVIEFEPAQPGERAEYTSSVRPIMNRLREAESVDRLCHLAARQLRSLIGFDRVMVYRFDKDGNGTVVAESKGASAEPFLGLHYPATDIPKQARALYIRNPIRIISDVDDDVSPIIPERNSDGEPLDLSLSTLRAVSPIHLEYLRNMGVAASMSISIVQRGKLWGLFACHHNSPRVLPYSLRTAAELFGELFSFLLQERLTDGIIEGSHTARNVHDRLMTGLAEGEPLDENFDRIVDILSDAISFDGAALLTDGQCQLVGKTPSREEVQALVPFLNTVTASRVYVTDHLSSVYPPAADYENRAAGLLALPISRSPRDYLILFRREQVQTVNWAGNPDKPVEVGKHGVRLTPRKSFEAWQQTVRGKSVSWTDVDIRTAESIRVTMLEVFLRMSDAANREREQARQQQELLIAELNHRVRNILNLIRGLVSQSRTDAMNVDEFTRVVGGRIHALGRAHDQVTQASWGPASLRTLIANEVEAFLGNAAERVVVDGVDPLIKPDAYTTLALVFHELITNSAKYGAMSDSRGRILIDLQREPDDALTIRWRERDGPVVQAPTRRGFGSTIIERSIPYDLKGTADIHYGVTGVEATFVIPGHAIAEYRTEEGAAAEPAAEQTGTGMRAAFDVNTALIVEDNMIIALDAEDLLMELGARKTLVASSVQMAEHLLETEQVDFALLDVNLGSETSMPVARALRDRNLPFVFATGYGDQTAFTSEFPETPVVQKPFNSARVAGALAKLDLPQKT